MTTPIKSSFISLGQTIQAFKEGPTNLRLSTLVLIIVNLFPLYGVLFLGWQIFPLIFLFWVECAILGIINVIKMLAIPDEANGCVTKIFLIPTFLFTYSLLILVYGAFIVAIFGGYLSPSHPSVDLLHLSPTLSERFGGLNLLLGIIPLAVGHIYSLITNYIGQGEYRKADLRELVNQPYQRLSSLHLVVVIGGCLVLLLHSPLIGLVLLIALKIIFDIRAHVNEHNRYKSADVVEAPDNRPTQNLYAVPPNDYRR